MTLLLSVFAAVISTFVWYKNAPEDIYRVRTLCFMFWGASLMWLVDAVFEYVADSASYFSPAPLDINSDQCIIPVHNIVFTRHLWRGKSMNQTFLNICAKENDESSI